MDAIRNLALALKAIEELNPENTSAGYNEWGEADCFGQAKKIAKDALDALDSWED